MKDVRHHDYIIYGKLHWNPRCLVKLNLLHLIFNKWHSAPKMELSVNYFGVEY